MNSKNISNEENITQSKSKIIFDNLKSDYFLLKLFNIMKKNKSLQIMKYNKKQQKRLNININDYKDYSQLYSPIEIELKIADNYITSPFIFLPDEDKKYYHIYFDNSNEEITRNYLNKNEKVKKIKIIIDYQIKSFKELFAYCYCISSIFFRKFYRINVINMGHMFYDCQSLINRNRFIKFSC